MKINKKYYSYILIMAILYGLQYYINNKITPVGVNCTPKVRQKKSNF